MKWIFLGLLVAHGLIHLMGFAKGFGLAKLEQLTRPVTQVQGMVWLTAALALLLTAVLVVIHVDTWWIVGFGALALSQAVICSAWRDARWGTVANVFILLVVLHGFASQGPFSFQADYRKQVGARYPKVKSPSVVSQQDLAPLPSLIHCYLKQSGALGKPRVHHFKARWEGRIRQGPDDPWMEFTAEQVNFIDEPARFFHLRASRAGLPVDVYHTFVDGQATMRVRLLSLLPIVDASGPEMDQAETVTLFNDMTLLAPATLIDPSIRWETIDDKHVRARFSKGSHTIAAVLTFNDRCELTDFVSDDRFYAAADGTFVQMRWSTPVRDYQNFGDRRVCSRGQGRWHPPEGEFTYLELDLLDLAINNSELAARATAWSQVLPVMMSTGQFLMHLILSH